MIVRLVRLIYFITVITSSIDDYYLIRQVMYYGLFGGKYEEIHFSLFPLCYCSKQHPTWDSETKFVFIPPFEEITKDVVKYKKEYWIIYMLTEEVNSFVQHFLFNTANTKLNILRSAGKARLTIKHNKNTKKCKKYFTNTKGEFENYFT